MYALAAEHSNGINGLLTNRDAASLRAVCKELCEEISGFRWVDMTTRINGHLVRGLNAYHRRPSCHHGTATLLYQHSSQATITELAESERRAFHLRASPSFPF